MSELVKTCTKCGEEKELNAENFNKNKANKDGYRGQCKECVKAYQKQYKKENKEKLARYQEQYYEENKEKLLRYQEQHYEENKEKIAKYQEQYYEENKEKIARYKEQYLQSEQGRKNYARANQNRRARINSLPDTLTTEQYDENLDHFDYKCAYCECELTPDNHHMEHVYPISRGVYGTTKENCIPSCESCNSSKGPKTISEWYVWTEDYSFERLLKIHEITSGGKEWIIN